MAESFVERLARLKAENDAAEAADAPPAWNPELIPEAPDSIPAGPRVADDIDIILGRVDILEAYAKWCGKMTPDPKGKRESIMISCPHPDHADAHPSAWANLDKDTYYCGTCARGGDIYTIAGDYFGLDSKTQFPELRRAMAVDLGHTIETTSGVSKIVQPMSDNPTESKTDASVEDLAQFLPDRAAEIPTLDWKALFPKDTFLRRWMEITSEDDLPEEYYVWLGLMALGLAVGPDAVLGDTPVVKGNLFLCLYGRSGIGKTRSTRLLNQLLEAALPYSDDVLNAGVQIVPVPGSAETLIDSFAKTELDPGTNVTIHYPVRGLVRFDELATLMGKSSRMGSVLKPILMEFYDSYAPVRTKSQGRGLSEAKEHFCSAITTTQPGAVRGLLARNDAESGFVNRWIFVAGPEKEPIAYQRGTLDITPCVTLLQGIKIWASAGRVMDLTGDALTAYETFFKQKIVPNQKFDKSDLITRCDLHLKKIITLLTVNEELDHPTLDIVERALAFWPYLQGGYALVGSEIGSTSGGPFDDAYDDIVETIQFLEKKLGHPPKRRDICRKIGRKHGAEFIAKVLKVMEQLEVVEVSITRGPSGVGRDIITYHYVP